MARLETSKGALKPLRAVGEFAVASRSLFPARGAARNTRTRQYVFNGGAQNPSFIQRVESAIV